MPVGNHLGNNVRSAVARGLAAQRRICEQVKKIEQAISVALQYPDDLPATDIKGRKIFVEGRLQELVMTFIQNLPRGEKGVFVALLRVLTTGKTPILQVQASASGVPHRQDATRPELWRLWTVFTGPEPFFRACFPRLGRRHLDRR
jgi:hypothetical protein